MAELFKAQLEAGIAQYGRKALRSALRDSLRVAGLYWRRIYLPIHFTRAAYRRYGYTPRLGDPGRGRAFKGSYQWKKLNQFKNEDGKPSKPTTRPLVYTGESEERSQRGQVIPRAQAADKGYVDITIPSPALNYQPPGFPGSMRKEVTTVIPEETAKLEAIMTRDLEKRLNRTFGRS